MNTFIKMSALAFLIQAGFIGQMLLTGIGGDVVYVLYGIPLILIGYIANLPTQGSNFLVVTVFSLFALFYSVLFGGLVFLIRRKWNAAPQD